MVAGLAAVAVQGFGFLCRLCTTALVGGCMLATRGGDDGLSKQTQRMNVIQRKGRRGRGRPGSPGIRQRVIGAPDVPEPHPTGPRKLLRHVYVATSSYSRTSCQLDATQYVSLPIPCNLFVSLDHNHL